MRALILYLAVVVLTFGIAIDCFSQAREISREDFYQPSREAYKKRIETARRETSQTKDYNDGKLSSTTETFFEFLQSDKRHSVSTRTVNGSTEKREYIQIDKTYYCRKNDADWVQSNKNCPGGFGAGSGGPSSIVSTKYTVEEAKINGQKVKLYQSYTTYKNIYSPNKDKEGLSYWQHKYWLSKDGFILREETEVGLLEPKRFYWQDINTYEYNPKDLKIEAPVK